LFLYIWIYDTGDAKFELITDASGRTTIKVKKERPPTRMRYSWTAKIILEIFVFQRN
jgi:hypothetical protein